MNRVFKNDIHPLRWRTENPSSQEILRIFERAARSKVGQVQVPADLMREVHQYQNLDFNRAVAQDDDGAPSDVVLDEIRDWRVHAAQAVANHHIGGDKPMVPSGVRRSLYG